MTFSHVATAAVSQRSEQANQHADGGWLWGWQQGRVMSPRPRDLRGRLLGQALARLAPGPVDKLDARRSSKFTGFPTCFAILLVLVRRIQQVLQSRT